MWRTLSILTEASLILHELSRLDKGEIIPLPSEESAAELAGISPSGAQW
ncbi:hypothetical protein TevJSym_aw00610 [endosymbiont of Tevnia jerichonana (vent Tica)]|uniref:Uncharacterized protein n=1 Tax=endosymbiont of Tevnia jerichonana (vent Tica) TaxID=1049564 RepID=G2FHR8_9GAMM|nr:hypothetical protein TevJSym_aw00610 [endosymbiont of Tevnia jerichonana (vent Tica)]